MINRNDLARDIGYLKGIKRGDREYFIDRFMWSIEYIERMMGPVGEVEVETRTDEREGADSLVTVHIDGGFIYHSVAKTHRSLAGGMKATNQRYEQNS